jgi:glyoxylase-like metal-dependent hydrolase (beta-lactamase superfamily II)
MNSARNPAPNLPVAQQWYSLKKFGDSTLLKETFVAPLFQSNIWFIQGRACNVAIDSGLGLVPLRPVLAEANSRPITLALTHAHRDHIGGAHEFDHVCIHRLEAEDARTATDNLPLNVDLWPEHLADAFEQAGYECRCGMLSALPTTSFAWSDTELRPTSVNRELEEGDIIDLGDRAFEVLHLAGHSPGSVGFFERTTRTLYSGDAIYDGPLLYEIPGANLTHYRDTMERLMRLDIAEVRPGHGPVFGKARLIEIARTMLDLWEQL